MGAQPGRPLSLLVALAGTEGPFQSPNVPVCGPLCMCAFWCVSVWVLLLGFFVFVFFFNKKKKMCIFLAMTET